ncbi:hypothetical protein DW103_14765 [Parabacteroides sp. AM08-6]|nr:hypothetical protein DW103_14765 [Parabacteroides sp. AM08-6]
MYTKGAFSYKICYLIDKKGYRKGKNLLEKNCRFKTYAYFCDEKKRTFILVISHFFPISFIYNSLHI